MQLSVIDVSEHQGNINWEKVKNAGVVGAMIRTGYGVKDPNQIDKWFYNNLSGCQNVGMPYGFYHYSYAVDVAGAEQDVYKRQALANWEKQSLTALRRLPVQLQVR